MRVSYPPFSPEELLALLRRRIPALQAVLPLRRVVLFGSYARGRQTAASDVDLLVVYAGEPREDAYAVVKRTLQIRRLQPHVHAAGEHGQVTTTVDRMVSERIRVEPGGNGGIPVTSVEANER